MANLNIPFILLQPQLCQFEPSFTTSKLIHHSKYNFQLQTTTQTAQSTSTQKDKYDSTQNTKNEVGGQQEHHLNNSRNNQIQSNIDEQPSNLLVLCDKQSGMIILCQQEQLAPISNIKTTNYKDQLNTNCLQRVNKFIVNIKPRVALIPSISEDSGPLLDHTLVRSPAPNILSTSTYFLVTLHADNIIRLWNTNDGRCVLSSQKKMLSTKASVIKSVKKHPGNIFVIGEQRDIYIVNVYKMTVLKIFQLEIHGCAGLIYKDNMVALCCRQPPKLNSDNQTPQELIIYLMKDDSSPSPQKDANQTILLELINKTESEIFSYNMQSIIALNEKDTLSHPSQGIDQILNSDQLDNQFLAFNYISVEEIIVVTSFRIDLSISKKRTTLLTFSKQQKLVFAKFTTLQEKEMLITIDYEMNFCVIDFKALKQQDGHTTEDDYRIISFNLIRDSQLFESMILSKENLYKTRFYDDEKEDKVQAILTAIMLLLKSCKTSPFKYQRQESLLYLFLQVNKQSTMITWNLELIIQSQCSFSGKIPMFMSEINIFPKEEINQLINFHPIIYKSSYNKLQLQFFFSDEKITDSVVYHSQNHPSLIISTNYGRIFMIPMFQDIHQDIPPIILIDQHHQSPITQLYLGYNSMNTQFEDQEDKKPVFEVNQLTLKMGYMVREKGGHLISVSEDGTIAVTYLNSEDIHQEVQSFMTYEKERSRPDQFMRERTQNIKNRRRNSITQSFTMDNYFYLVKVRSLKVFQLDTFGSISNILQVKDLRYIQENLKEEQQSNTDSNQAETKNDDGLITIQISDVARKPQRKFESITTYACIATDGVVFMLQPSQTEAQMTKITGLDSQAIGVYSRDEFQQYFFLCQSLNVYIYNKKSSTIERKCNYQYALDLLMIKERVTYLINKNEPFKSGFRGESHIFEFDSFDKFFRKKSCLIGLGSHKILDYLNLSLNFPLQYHPNKINSTKYTKYMYELLQLRQLLRDFNKKDLYQKEVLVAMNDLFFLNDKQYKSDYNSEQFKNLFGITTVQTGNTVFRSKQHILIASSKQMQNILKRNKQSPSNETSESQMSKKLSTQQSNQIDEKQDLDLQSTDEYFCADSAQLSRENSYHSLASGINQEATYLQEIQAQKAESNQQIRTKWPTRLLSLIHPFNVDKNIDEAMKTFYGLSLPFLDLRIGLQGAGESFTFVISKEDEEYNVTNQNTQKLMSLLRLSANQKTSQQQESQELSQKESALNNDYQTPSTFIQQQTKSSIQFKASNKFFGQEYWKISNYLSSIVPTFFLSIMVSTVEYSQDQIQFMLQQWLCILQKINKQKTLNHENEISLSVLSKIILEKDSLISTTGRDVILKPLLYTLNQSQLQMQVNEWSSLILDIYKKLKKESKDRHIKQLSHNATQPRKSDFLRVFNIDKLPILQQQSQNPEIVTLEKKLFNSEFGELEIRGIINISYFSLYFNEYLDTHVQNRICKLTAILTKEIIEKFHNDKRYIHLLTLLLQLLNTWMKSQGSNFKSKYIISEVIKLLLFIYGMNKQPLSTEKAITKITGENFLLAKPKDADLYLKLTAAKVMLEIGQNFPQEFLKIVQEEAIHFQHGPEYQSNVLDILKFFINGYSENLEGYLVQITSIIIKCLDSNELALRKLSRKAMNSILSKLIKVFPMVAFHHDSQQMAIGGHNGSISIFDIRSSTKRKYLEGHQGNITCLAFDSTGNQIATYSAVDLSLRVWKIGNAGFIQFLLGEQYKCTSRISLKIIKAKNPHIKQKHTFLQDLVHQDSNIYLLGEDPLQDPKQKHSVRVNKCVIKFIQYDSQIELTREDGVKEYHRITK